MSINPDTARKTWNLNGPMPTRRHPWMDFDNGSLIDKDERISMAEAMRAITVA